ncbi:glycine betaine ABC transporter substrate-binding protein [soil metagenome]
MRPAISLVVKSAFRGPLALWRGRGVPIARGRMLAIATMILLSSLSAGCGAFGSGRQITIEHMGWDENVAVSNLSKVLLEEELGYRVNLKLANKLDAVFPAVAEGDSDVFQDVWMPNHKQLLEEVKGDVEHLQPWFRGKTSYGIAVPDYMKIDSVAELQNSGTDKIIGIEPRAAFHPQITEKVIPAYDLDVVLVESSTRAMLSEWDQAYEYEEPIAFLAWSAHWMNGRYDFHYLEDPKDAQGVFNDPAKISSIVNRDYAERDSTAYGFLNALSLSEDDLIQLEVLINEQGSKEPMKGVRAWLEENRDTVQPWIDAARDAENS